jgi:hypothetical protein
MAQGKQIGDFQLKATSITYTPGPGNALTAQVNVEGEVTGELAGKARGTLTVIGEPGAKSGTYSYCGVTLLGNGALNAVSSQGVVENMGNHKRRLRGVGRFSDGRLATVEAEGDLMAGTLNGNLYE